MLSVDKRNYRLCAQLWYTVYIYIITVLILFGSAFWKEKPLFCSLTNIICLWSFLCPTTFSASYTSLRHPLFFVLSVLSSVLRPLLFFCLFFVFCFSSSVLLPLLFVLYFSASVLLPMLLFCLFLVLCCSFSVVCLLFFFLCSYSSPLYFVLSASVLSLLFLILCSLSFASSSVLHPVFFISVFRPLFFVFLLCPLFFVLYSSSSILRSVFFVFCSSFFVPDPLFFFLT